MHLSLWDGIAKWGQAGMYNGQRYQFRMDYVAIMMNDVFVID